MVAYNVANLKSKLKFNNFFSFINEFDVFFLFETHVLSENRSDFYQFFQNFVLFWIDSKKVKNAGRSSGGCLYGFRKTLQSAFSFKFESLNENVYLSATFGDKNIKIIPRYINCNKWKTEFDNFENFLNDLRLSSFCIIGDLNARIGESQVIDEGIVSCYPSINASRFSKDKKLIQRVENCWNLSIIWGALF